MVDHVQGMDGVSTRTKKETVRSEPVLFLRIDRPRARIVGLRIEALFEVRAWVQSGRGLVSNVDQRNCSRSCISRGNHPVRPGHEHKIFRTDETADELDISRGVTSSGSRR